MKSTEKSVKNMPFSLLIFEHNEILNDDKIGAPLLEPQRCFINNKLFKSIRMECLYYIANMKEQYDLTASKISLKRKTTHIYP